MEVWPLSCGTRIQLDSRAGPGIHVKGPVRDTCAGWLVCRQLFDFPPFFWAHTCIKLGSALMGFLEPSSGDTKSAHLVGRDVSSMEAWRAAAPNTVSAAIDLNMDSVYVLPQLSGGNFAYTRLRHVSHGVFSAAPIQGAFALPAAPADFLVSQLRAQAMTQSRLYGGAPSAAIFVPPPPGRGRSAVRVASAPRMRAPEFLATVPDDIGIRVFVRFSYFSPSFGSVEFCLSPGRPISCELSSFPSSVAYPRGKA